jgi:hypothetical protein
VLELAPSGVRKIEQEDFTMGTSPAAPRAPEPPRSSHWVAIALLSLALVVIVSGVTILLGLRFLSRGLDLSIHETGKGVDIKTPVGSFDVRKEVSEGQLGLPIYPGSERLHENGGATISFGLPERDNVRILAAKYTTSDPPEKVRDFYKQQLGNEVTKLTQKDNHGQTVFEIKKPKDEKIVAVRPREEGSEISLVRIVESKGETN